MSLCRFFTDPAEACACRAGVNYLALAGGGAHYVALRLPCYDLSNRRGEVSSPCSQYEPAPDEEAP